MKIEISSGPLRGRRYLIPIGRSVPVGRDASTGIVLANDRAMSREHFLLEFDGVACRFRDLGSRNGTMLNGTRVTQGVLQDQDRLRAGETDFIILMVRESPQIGSILRKTIQIPDINSATPLAATSLNVTQTIAASGGDLRPYQAALVDQDADVRREALWTAAWTRQPWLLSHCRLIADVPTVEHLDELRLLAILGGEADTQRILGIGGTSDLGADRFSILASFGHPDVVPLLLDGMCDPDPAAAAAAGAAFERITGIAVESVDVEAAIESTADENLPAAVPDAEFARTAWNERQTTYQAGSRWCRGVDLSHGFDPDKLNQLDTESRYEAFLRARFHRQWHGTPAELRVLSATVGGNT